MIRFIQYGCGKMSGPTMNFAIENGMELVGAVDIAPELVGKTVGDLNTVKSHDFDYITISATEDFQELLMSATPDIVIIETRSLFKELEEVLTICAQNGVNAITTCEEAFYPFVSSPALSEKIDTLAKQNNCTITGTGYQDAFWGNLVTTLAGATHGITKIKGSSSYNVEDYGIALAEAHGAGMSLADFDAKIASVDRISKEERQDIIQRGEYLPSYMWNVVPWLAEKLHLHLTNMTQKCIPTTHTADIDSTTLGRVVRAGEVTGMSAIVTGTTEEGVVIEAEAIGKIYAPDDMDTNDWTVFGSPNTRMVISEPNTVDLTCATIVNRIPDVISAEAGLVPTCRMGELSYRLPID